MQKPFCDIKNTMQISGGKHRVDLLLKNVSEQNFIYSFIFGVFSFLTSPPLFAPHLLPALLALLAFLPLPSFAAAIVRGPYIENVSLKSGVVRWRLDSPSHAWLTYGIYPDCSRFTTISPTVREHAVTVNGLTGDTTHCYRIYLPVEEASGVQKAAEGAFKTLRPRESPDQSFMLFGDSASESEEHMEIALQMEKFNPDFVINIGDIVDTGLDKDADMPYFQSYKNLLKKTPFFLALGNHDYGRSRKNLDDRNFIRKNYLPFHQMPWSSGSPHYYFFDNGDARFICLDTNFFEEAKSAPSFEKGSRQMKWLETVLSGTRAAWKFVYMHHPAYSTGGHGSIPGLAEVLAPVLEKHKVDMVFSGHDHDYERTHPIRNGVRSDADGIIYLTVGGGGQPLYIQRIHADWSAKFMPVYHFAWFQIRGKELRMDVYDREGRIIDTLQLRKP
ncbi:MAG: metallophosphoesterase [bacterium]